jgi:hypothetical protein
LLLKDFYRLSQTPPRNYRSLFYWNRVTAMVFFGSGGPFCNPSQKRLRQWNKLLVAAENSPLKDPTAIDMCHRWPWNRDFTASAAGRSGPCGSMP